MKKRTKSSHFTSISFVTNEMLCSSRIESAQPFIKFDIRSLLAAAAALVSLVLSLAKFKEVNALRPLEACGVEELDVFLVWFLVPVSFNGLPKCDYRDSFSAKTYLDTGSWIGFDVLALTLAIW